MISDNKNVKSKFRVVFIFEGRTLFKDSESTDANIENGKVHELKYNSIVLMNILQCLKENKIFFKDSITVTNVTLYKDNEKIGSWGQLIISYSFVA